MQNSSTDYHELLSSFLFRLVEVVRYENEYAWKLLSAVTLNKSVGIAIDSVALHVQATDNNKYTLQIRKATSDDKINFITTGDVLRDIITGRTTLDNTLATGKLYVESTLENLDGMYRLVVCLLAEGAVNIKIRALWAAFDQHWPPEHATMQNEPSPLDEQLPIFAELINKIPSTVLLIGKQ